MRSYITNSVYNERRGGGGIYKSYISKFGGGKRVVEGEVTLINMDNSTF